MRCTACEEQIDPGDEITVLQFGRAKMSAKSGQLILDPTQDPLPFHDKCLIDWSVDNGWLDRDEFLMVARELVEDEIRDATIEEIEALGLLLK